ncbi:MAG: isoprenylcysteine carboxylmethyltransferase family protein [Chloroflexota bacterium]|jgi:protein-S-isoprenylcysteine O-methyltransferase
MQPILFDVPRLYAAIFIAASAVWAVPEIVGTFLQRSRAAANRQDRGSYGVVMGSIGIGFAGAFLSAAWLPQLAITANRYLIFWLGIALMLAGIALRWYAIAVLGRSFTRDVVTREGQALVQTGPYRVIRHPAYSGSLLTIVGTGIVLGNAASLIIITLGGLIGILYRIRVEEEALLGALGEPYRAYMSRTRRLIPFVW